MRHSISMILLSAGVVLSLAGCQKDPSNYLSGKAVRFSATSASAETRTAFSGDGTQKKNAQNEDMTDEFGRKILTWERIDWEVGDEVMIASNNATVWESNQKYATYKVESVTANGQVSEARVEEKDSDQELFFNDAESYTFWGVYPASVGEGSTLATGKVNYSISNPVIDGTETITKDGEDKTLTVLKPDMTQAVMLAKKDNVTSEAVDLEFNPAFTAFEFTLLAKEDVEIPLQKVVFTSGSALTGKVSANLNTGEYTFTQTANELTFTFPAGTVISKTKYVTFTFFALPQDIEGLSMEFYMGTDTANPTHHKGTLKQGDDPITFDACKKHSLRGVAVKSGWEFSSITLNLQAIDWVPVTKDTDDYLQASQFEITGAATEDTNTRQLWHVEDGNTFKISYKVFLPVGGTWSIVPAGDTGSFTITGATSGTVVDGGTRVTLEITPNSGSFGKQLYFNTYVTADGVQYNLDSETQLYDMRGYHYFKVD